MLTLKQVYQQLVHPQLLHPRPLPDHRLAPRQPQLIQVINYIIDSIIDYVDYIIDYVIDSGKPQKNFFFNASAIKGVKGCAIKEKRTFFSDGSVVPTAIRLEGARDTAFKK